MQDFWEEIGVGWREAAWTGRFTLIALPGTLFVFLLAAAIQGHVSDPPSALVWAMEVPVVWGALCWAGWHDGPEGFVGRTVWRGTTLAMLLYAVSQARRLPLGTHRFHFRAGGYELALILHIKQPDRAPKRGPTPKPPPLDLLRHRHQLLDYEEQLIQV